MQSPDAVLKLSAPPLTLPATGRAKPARFWALAGVAASDPFHSPLLPRGGSLHAGSPGRPARTPPPLAGRPGARRSAGWW